MSTELQDLTVEQLRAFAGERGITVPERAKKAELIEAIEAAAAADAEAGDQDAQGDTGGDTPADAGADANAADPASPQANEGDAPADTGAGEDALVETETELDNGLVEVRRPIEHVNARGDWTCPFSGLRVMAGSLICPQSGAHRDGDEAYIVTAPDEES